MKIYIVVRNTDSTCKENVIVTSSKKVAEHIIGRFNFIDSYAIEDHDLLGNDMMESN